MIPAYVGFSMHLPDTTPSALLQGPLLTGSTVQRSKKIGETLALISKRLHRQLLATACLILLQVQQYWISVRRPRVYNAARSRVSCIAGAHISSRCWHSLGYIAMSQEIIYKRGTSIQACLQGDVTAVLMLQGLCHQCSKRRP